VRLGLALAILLVALAGMALAPRLRGSATEQTAARGEVAATPEPPALAGGTGSLPGHPGSSPVTAPSPTAAAPARLTAPAGPIRAEAAISDPAPPRTARLMLTGRLLRGDAGIAGVPMRSVWHFRSGDATCNSRAGTDAEGRATCVFTMSGAAPGREVVVDVLFEYEGRSYRAQVRFTPQ
jgi:hypothetical protein